jgi:hypothetical protein
VCVCVWGGGGGQGGRHDGGQNYLGRQAPGQAGVLRGVSPARAALNSPRAASERPVQLASPFSRTFRSFRYGDTRAAPAARRLGGADHPGTPRTVAHEPHARPAGRALVAVLGSEPVFGRARGRLTAREDPLIKALLQALQMSLGCTR